MTKSVAMAAGQKAQAMTHVAGTVRLLAEDLPAKLARQIAPQGVGGPAGRRYSVFADWSKTGGLQHRVLPPNFRTSRLARQLSGDVQFVDFKGIGQPKFEEFNERERPFRNNPELERVNGLMHVDVAAHQVWHASNALLNAGVNTEKPLALIELHELLDEKGRRISVDDAKARGLIPVQFNPGILVRGLTEFDRICGLTKERLEKYYNANKAKHGWNAREDVYGWWVKRAAANVARMHDANLVHCGLGDQNFLIDGGFVDNDQVTHKSNRLVARDLNDAMDAVRSARAAFVNGHFKKGVFDESLAITQEELEEQQSLFAKHYFAARKKIGRQESLELSRYLGSIGKEAARDFVRRNNMLVRWLQAKALLQSRLGKTLGQFQGSLEYEAMRKAGLFNYRALPSRGRSRRSRRTTA